MLFQSSTPEVVAKRARPSSSAEPNTTTGAQTSSSAAGSAATSSTQPSTSVGGLRAVNPQRRRASQRPNSLRNAPGPSGVSANQELHDQLEPIREEENSLRISLTVSIDGLHAQDHSFLNAEYSFLLPKMLIHMTI